jgi:hypothetical protein
MKKIVSVLMVVALLGLSSLAFAAEMKIVGIVEKVEIQGTSAIVTLKDNKSGAKVPIVVTDPLSVDKMKDKRIVVGDEIRCKYDNASGKNVSKLFRKTAGC